MDNTSKKDIVIDDEIFRHVKTRPHADVSVYKGNGCFLRIGSPDLIQKEIGLHNQLTGFDFPLPQILKEGVFKDKRYFIEASLGEYSIGDVFLEDMTREKGVANEHFQDFLQVTEKFAKAQLKSIRHKNWWEEFYQGSYVDTLMEELPHLKVKIILAVEKAKERLLPLPAVITHNDLNPYNLFNDGVIDLEFVFYAPAGLDLVSNIFITSFFPKEGDFEYKRSIEFSEEQINGYLSFFDNLYSGAGIPVPTSHLDDLLFFRAVHASVGMNAAPKLQTWRFSQFEKLLEAYIHDQAIRSFWGA